MELIVTVTDEKTSKNYKLVKTDGPKTIDDFILELLSISEDKRQLPLVVYARNGLEVRPEIKMKFENDGSPLLGNKLEKMVIAY